MKNTCIIPTIAYIFSTLAFSGHENQNPQQKTTIPKMQTGLGSLQTSFSDKVELVKKIYETNLDHIPMNLLVKLFAEILINRENYPVSLEKVSELIKAKTLRNKILDTQKLLPWLQEVPTSILLFVQISKDDSNLERASKLQRMALLIRDMYKPYPINWSALDTYYTLEENRLSEAKRYYLSAQCYKAASELLKRQDPEQAEQLDSWTSYQLLLSNRAYFQHAEKALYKAFELQ